MKDVTMNFSLNRKELLSSVHFFVHLNLSIALLLGYIVFIAGLDHAVDDGVNLRAQAFLPMKGGPGDDHGISQLTAVLCAHL